MHEQWKQLAGDLVNLMKACLCVLAALLSPFPMRGACFSIDFEFQLSRRQL